MFINDDNSTENKEDILPTTDNSKCTVLDEKKLKLVKSSLTNLKYENAAEIENAFTNLYNPCSIDPLVSLLFNNRSKKLFLLSLEALSLIPDPKVLLSLIDALYAQKSITENEIRQLAEDKQRKIFGTTIHETLFEFHERVIAIVKVIGKVGDHRAIEPLTNFLDNRNWPDSTLMDYLKKDRSWITGSSSKVIKPIIDALKKIKDPQSLEPLIKAYLDRYKMYYRSHYGIVHETEIFSVIKKLNHPNTLNYLKNIAINDSFYQNREAAVILLGDLNKKGSLDALKAALEDDEFMVRLAAKEALKKMHIVVRSDIMKLGKNNQPYIRPEFE